jgi:hypothetical protein
MLTGIELISTRVYHWSFVRDLGKDIEEGGEKKEGKKKRMGY